MLCGRPAAAFTVLHTRLRLLNSTGSLLGIACADRHIPDNARVAAVASSIWAEYYKACERSLGGRQLEVLLLDMEEGRVGVAHIDQEYLLACVASSTALWGMLKLKLEQGAAVFAQRLQRLGQVNPAAEEAPAPAAAAAPEEVTAAPKPDSVATTDALAAALPGGSGEGDPAAQ